MFFFPLDNLVVTSRFIIYNTLGRSMHYGMDYACGVGTPVYAANSGTVCLSLFDNAGGNMIGINGDHELSRYAHLSQRLVKVGDKVKAGDLIGYSGNTGSATTGAHLHFETWITPANYKYNYADRTKYAVDPMAVCHLKDGAKFNNNGLATMQPIPIAEPTPESSRLVSGKMVISNGSVRFRLIPETKSYQYIVGGYNRASDTFKSFFNNGTYNVSAVAVNEGYNWALVNTELGSYWVAEIEGKTKIEADVPVDPPADNKNELNQLKWDLESANLTIEKLRATIDAINDLARYN